MKIAILTHAQGHNYGGILQNWALQQILIRLGHNPLTIRYWGLTKVRKFLFDMILYTKYYVKRLLRHPTRHQSILPKQYNDTCNEYNPAYRLMRDFVHHNTRLTPLISPITFDKLVNAKFDCIIVGSDQVWRLAYMGHLLSEMFCAFVPEEATMPRIAYAASFGIGQWDYNRQQTDMASNAIKRFRAISVREKSGVKLCREYLGIDAVQTLDPTLLLTPTDYDSLIPPKILMSVPDDCVGIYILDLSQGKRKIIESVCKILNKRPHYFGVSVKCARQNPPVEHWLASVKKSSFIITDSFHGTAFAINYHVPFISIANSKRGTDRFSSILDSLGLGERMINESESDIGQKLNIVQGEVDWQNVDKVLSALRTESIDFLRSNLK